MKLYFDTSVLVSLVTNEMATPRVIDWFSEQDGHNVVISNWNITEFHSALALKLRTGQISASLRTGAESLFRRYIDQNFSIISIESSDFARAAELAAWEALKLRAGDALHLAKVEAAGLQICTMDRNLFDAAESIAVPALNPAASSG